MSETQLDRLERKFDNFVEYVQARFEDAENRSRDLENRMAIEFAAVRSEIAEVRSELKAEIAAFRLDMREQLENVTDRLKLLEKSYGVLSGELPKLRRTISYAINELRDEIEQLRLKTEAIETATLDTSLRVIQLRDDVQQRFRVMNDRLSGLEKRLAA